MAKVVALKICKGKGRSVDRIETFDGKPIKVGDSLVYVAADEDENFRFRCTQATVTGINSDSVTVAVYWNPALRLSTACDCFKCFPLFSDLDVAETAIRDASTLTFIRMIETITSEFKNLSILIHKSVEN